MVAENGRVLGVVHLKDIVKGGMRERFAHLRAMGIKTVMITGDNPLTAAAIAAEAGVDDFMAEATPEDKLKLIRTEQAGGRMVAMTGDGTNDAPALAQADVGVAMNTGTMAAKEAGNMVDLDSNPTKLIEIVEIGKQLLMTRGSLTTFSIANDVAKYFAIIPAMFILAFPQLTVLNVMRLATPQSAILSAVIFNAVIIIALIPLALRGIAYKPLGAAALLRTEPADLRCRRRAAAVRRHQGDRRGARRGGPGVTSRSGLGEAVAHPRFGEDVPRHGRRRLDLLAQRGDQDAQVLGLIHVRAPDRLHDGAMGEHPTGMLCEECQELELLRRQPHLLAVSHDAKALPIDHQVAADDWLGWLRRSVTAQRRAHTRQQFLGPERFGDVVVGTRIERANLVAFRTAGRQHDDRDRQALTNPAAHLDSVDVRQAQVQDDEVRLLPVDSFERGVTGHGVGHVIPASTEQRGQRADDVRLVVDDQDLGRHVQLARTGLVRPGTTIVNRAPAPGAFSPQTRPSAAVSKPRVMASPIPVPGTTCLAERPR